MSSSEEEEQEDKVEKDKEITKAASQDLFSKEGIIIEE